MQSDSSEARFCLDGGTLISCRVAPDDIIPQFAEQFFRMVSLADQNDTMRRHSKPSANVNQSANQNSDFSVQAG